MNSTQAHCQLSRQYHRHLQSRLKRKRQEDHHALFKLPQIHDPRTEQQSKCRGPSHRREDLGRLGPANVCGTVNIDDKGPILGKKPNSRSRRTLRTSVSLHNF